MDDLEERFNQLFSETDPEELKRNGEGIEAIVMKNYYYQVFNVPQEQAFIKKLSESIQIHQQFVRPEHLEIPQHRIITETLTGAAQLLAQMSPNKIPNGKL